MKLLSRSAVALLALASFFLFQRAASASVPGVEVLRPRGISVLAPVTAFDDSHAEIFSPLKSGPLHFSEFYGMIKSAGKEVSINRDPITPLALERVRTYIIAGPSMQIKPDEIAALNSFVERGGRLLVLIHVSEPVARLTESFGIIVSNFVLSESNDTIGNEPQDFFVTSFLPHPVTEGVKRLAFYGSWALLPEGRSSSVAATSAGSWADTDGDGLRGEGEPEEAFSVAAVTERGLGRVAVIADDAPFTNLFMKEADNERFVKNIIKWLDE
ncbi:MAG: DUF4350 domain-containing protein [Deltaproteobacteria bacterium]|nr:DUF4350 domain-containing protein [Deltaproteobacteria bacterium]